MSSLEKGRGLCSWTLRSSVSLTPIDSGRSAIHPYSAGSTEAKWLARDYAELVADFFFFFLVADFWLEATSFYSQLGIFPFDCFWKYPLLLENNSRQDIIKCRLNNQFPLHMGKVHCYLVYLEGFEEWVWCEHHKRTRKIWSLLLCCWGTYIKKFIFFSASTSL